MASPDKLLLSTYFFSMFLYINCKICFISAKGFSMKDLWEIVAFSQNPFENGKQPLCTYLHCHKICFVILQRLIEHLTYIRSYKNIFQTNLSYIDYMYFKHRHRFWWWLKNTDTEILSQLQTKTIRAYFQTIPFWAEPSVYSKKPSKKGAMLVTGSTFWFLVEINSDQKLPKSYNRP